MVKLLNILSAIALASIQAQTPSNDLLNKAKTVLEKNPELAVQAQKIAADYGLTPSAVQEKASAVNAPKIGTPGSTGNVQNSNNKAAANTQTDTKSISPTTVSNKDTKTAHNGTNSTFINSNKTNNIDGVKDKTTQIKNNTSLKSGDHSSNKDTKSTSNTGKNGTHSSNNPNNKTDSKYKRLPSPQGKSASDGELATPFTFLITTVSYFVFYSL